MRHHISSNPVLGAIQSSGVNKYVLILRKKFLTREASVYPPVLGITVAILGQRALNTGRLGHWKSISIYINKKAEKHDRFAEAN